MRPIPVELPQRVRTAIALTYDTDMAGREAHERWRREHGHSPVPEGWRPPFLSLKGYRSAP
ncbi:MAG TPA: hypothetical protein EYP17_10795 [Candidatus Latescibacteria bacterium]|nr:hypothetical protein [Candidatus Latescibacterota bacterium]